MLNPKLPLDDYSLVIRTDFTDEAKWRRVSEAIQSPVGEEQFQASVECLSDQACAGLSPAEVCALVPGAPDERLFVFIVDSLAISNAEHPVLVVDTEDPGRTFRVIPAAAWAVEANLRLANMGFDDFELSLDADGIYRGVTRDDT